MKKCISRIKIFIVLSILSTLFTVAIAARSPLTFQQRVEAQIAIERVYYKHRIWPKGNPGPKPPFDQLVTKAQIEAKVRDYLKKSEALETYWQRSITSEQLQAEMNRMVEGSKDPTMLKELFEALDNDPYVIAECLARPVLAERLIENWYAYDGRFQQQARLNAEEALNTARETGLSLCTSGDYFRKTFLLGNSESDVSVPLDIAKSRDVSLTPDQFKRTYNKIPEPGNPPVLKETREAFIVVRTITKTSSRIELEGRYFSKSHANELIEKLSSVSSKQVSAGEFSFKLPERKTTSCRGDWRNESLDALPLGRIHASSIWTGTEMIIWGGQLSGNPLVGSGGRYNPATDTWKDATAGPIWPPRGNYLKCVWTGEEMLIWGGNSGARYNPVTETWATISTTDCPSGIENFTAVWTGSVMIVWGGSVTSDSSTNSGGCYDPSSDTWTPTSTGANCPQGRNAHIAVWTGTEMMIWGGCGGWNSADYYDTGGLYNPLTDTWRPTSTGEGCPAARNLATAVWTGSEVIIWGGWIPYPVLDGTNTGARYNPSSDTWTATTMDNCPYSRYYHTAVWTGSRMIVWGGIAWERTNTGGIYNPDKDKWVQTSTGVNCPKGRSYHTAVWTGQEMIVWGGMDSDNYFTNTGGRYNPDTDSWVPTSLGPNCPDKRLWFGSVWTGSELIVWGGTNKMEALYSIVYDSGGRYTPSTDSWSETSTGDNCPEARENLTAVWTGSEMIVWGGDALWGMNTGGRYNPVSDSWTPTSTTYSPVFRFAHTAVWTGTAMIVWGGYNHASGFLNSGGVYSPASDTWQITALDENTPGPRVYHTAVWTGSEMVIWGGDYQYMPLDIGGSYNPHNNSWTATSLVNAPTAREHHTAVWTGKNMIIWGGDIYGYDHATGGEYDPSTDTWQTVEWDENCPTKRENHTAVWTGSEMIIWGGGPGTALSDGGRYDPVTGHWKYIPDEQGSPSPRYYHQAVWTGTGMIIWGGWSSDEAWSINTGGIYYPNTDPRSMPALSTSLGGDDVFTFGTGETLSLDGSASTDGSNPETTVPYHDECDSIVSYEWDLDGDADYGVECEDSSGGVDFEGATPEALTESDLVSLGIVSAGSHSIWLRVTDESGSKSCASVDFTLVCDKPGVPLDVHATGTCDGNTITWPGVSGATSYKVCRGTTCGVADVSFPDVTSPFSDASAVPGTAYQYWVKGINSCGEGSPSSCVSSSRLQVPSSPSAPSFTSVAAMAVDVNWMAVDGATSYDVWRADGDSCNDAVKITASPVTGTLYPDSGLDPCTEYSYYIVANNECGLSMNGTCATVTTASMIPSAPGAPTFQSVGCETLEIHWTAVTGATQYDVWRAESGDCSGAVKITATPVEATTYSDSGLSSLTQYSYFIVASNNCGTSTDGACAAVTTTYTPASPTGITANGTCSGVTVSWTASSGSVSYSVVRGTSCGSALDTFSGAVSPYEDTSAVPGVTYYYWVYGVNSCGVSPDSSCASAVRLGVPSAPTAPIFTNVTGTTLTLNWTSVPDTTDYDVWRQAGSTCSGAVKINISPITGNSYDDTGLSIGTEYSYFVTANDGCGPSGSGVCASVTTRSPPSTPVITSTTPSDSDITLTWTVSTDTGGSIDHYTIYGGPSGPVTAGSTPFDLTGLAPGTEYQLSVSATNDVGLESSASEETCISTTSTGLAPQTPCSTTSVYPDDAPITFTYTAGGDTKWRVYVYQDAGLTTKVTTSKTRTKKWLTETSWTPNSNKWKKILTGGASTGVVYWQVTGKLGGVSEARTLCVAGASQAVPLTPSDGGSVSSASPATFTWTLDHNKQVQVEFSSTSDFSSGVEVSSKKNRPGKKWIKGETWTAPSGKWDKIVAMGATVYWRVHAKDALGRETYSQIFALNITS